VQNSNVIVEAVTAPAQHSRSHALMGDAAFLRACQDNREVWPILHAQGARDDIVDVDWQRASRG